jgi:hypothetical protein
MQEEQVYKEKTTNLLGSNEPIAHSVILSNHRKVCALEAAAAVISRRLSMRI